jgi:hypothetical protein
MREFAKGQFRLRDGPRTLRMIYAGFLLLTLIGLATQIGFQTERIGFRPAAIARYYRGDDTGLVMVFPKTFGQLLELTHAHAFVMAVVFLILAHLFAGTAVPVAVKTCVLGATFGGLLGDLVGPWLTRYAADGFSWVVLGSWIAEDGGLAVLVAISGWECLVPGPRR